MQVEISETKADVKYSDRKQEDVYTQQPRGKGLMFIDKKKNSGNHQSHQGRKEDKRKKQFVGLGHKYKNLKYHPAIARPDQRRFRSR